MIYANRKTLVKIIWLGCLLLGCETEGDIEETDFKKYVITDTQVFLKLENTSFLGNPSSLKAVSEGLLIVDNGYSQITKVDYQGKLILSFGKEGRGPGEFQSIAGFWPFENEYLVYDYNSFKFSIFDHSGKLIDEEVLDENPANPSSNYSIPITLDAMSPDKLLIPTGGRQGSLFALADLISGEVVYAGSAIAEFIGNSQDDMQAYSRGENPRRMLNMVMLRSNSSAIYSLQQSTGKLEKYTHDGSKVWEKALNIPAQRNLFDQIAEHNKDMGIGHFPRLFIYARSMDVHESGVALLLNLQENQPLTIAWIPEDGSNIDLIEVDGITLDGDGFREAFTISPDRKQAYFLDRSSGTIYQFEWPL